MTPGARVAAAMEVIGDLSAGQAVEQSLTRWARRSRFAGSKDRAAVRDHVFDALRLWRTSAHHGGGQSPRQIMVGLLHQQGADLSALFSGEGHAPEPLQPDEWPQQTKAQSQSVRWNLPDWLIPPFQDALGAEAEETALALQGRAPVTLRVNIARATIAEAARLLASEQIATRPNPRCETALTVEEGARKIRQSRAYQEGLVEVQDASSQAAVAGLPPGRRVLDLCAGGGGKALAIAAQPERTMFAHDANAARMADLTPRAARAEANITVLDNHDLEAAGPFDLVLVDAPCSGSGTWRRAPQAKWRLTPDDLDALTRTQDAILRQAAGLVAPAGTLAYATCSILREENEQRIEAFLQGHPDWHCIVMTRFGVSTDGDGFYVAHLKRLKSDTKAT